MDDHIARAARSRPGVRSRWLWPLAFAGFFLVIGAWAIALPPNAGPDESSHVIRAAGVADFQIRPNVTGDGVFDAQHVVPAGYHMSVCFITNVGESADCIPAFDKHRTWRATSAGRYFPGYYMLVGAPLNLWPGPIGLMLARLISAAAAAALLACSFVALARWSRHGLMLGGLVVATTPMVAHVAATINPNGLEIAAGIALFASLIPLALRDHDRPTNALVLLFGVSAVILVTGKANGPVWLGIAALPFVLPWRRSNLPHLLKDRIVRLVILGIALAVGASAAWTLALKSYVVIPVPGTDLQRDQAFILMMQRWPGFSGETVALIGWGDTRAPELIYPLWAFAGGCLLLLAVAVGTRLDRWRLGALVGFGIGVPFALQLVQAPRYGFITQGRYLLPLLVGVPLLAAFVIESRLLDAARARSLNRVLAVLLVPLHVLTLAYVMVRYQHGLAQWPDVLTFERLNPLTGSWLPPTGPLLPLVMVVTGAATMLWLVWRGRPAAFAEPVTEPVTEPVVVLVTEPVVVPRQRPASEPSAGAPSGGASLPTGIR